MFDFPVIRRRNRRFALGTTLYEAEQRENGAAGRKDRNAPASGGTGPKNKTGGRKATRPSGAQYIRASP
jgi:hypothetical protein